MKQLSVFGYCTNECFGNVDGHEHEQVMNNERKLVLVNWEDSVRPLPEWCHLEDIPALEIVECVSVGFIVGESQRVLMLAPNLGDVGTSNVQASGCIRIPKSCISNQVELTCGHSGNKS
tara:strand:- start:965 stop:1321 length:357 start_codon:yes stop_codon:yes gene_type:complete